MHPAPLRERRSFDCYPFDLADQKTFINGYQKVTVYTRKRSRHASGESDGLGRLDIQGNLDLVWRYKIHCTNP